jgi:hypothetical protein
VGNKARVEGCIAEQFKLKEVAHFTSCYFAEEHNVFARKIYLTEDQYREVSIQYVLPFLLIVVIDIICNIVCAGDGSMDGTRA